MSVVKPVRDPSPFLKGWGHLKKACTGRLLATLILTVCHLPFLGQTAAAANASCTAEWPLWQQLTTHYLSQDGRIIDDSVPTLHSTSEGQSYGMFFALVANDRERFDLLWQWTLNNLLSGKLDDTLPAWQWGLRQDGTWGIIDHNAASDANLWFAYALLEAARLWQEPKYAEQGLQLARLVAEQEWAELPGFGTQLLPAPFGFYDAESQTWRLNPSYLVLPQMRLLARRDAKHHWNSLAKTTPVLIREVSPFGLAPDWVAYQTTGPDQGRFLPDPVHSTKGSYDAIRTYLWAGITSSADPLAQPLRQALFGMTDLTKRLGHIPETVDTATGQGQGLAPLGFAAALLPIWAATGQSALLNTYSLQVRERFEQWQATNLPRPAYYEMMLAMFGLGWHDRYYRFAADGSLSPRWNTAC